MQTNSSRILSKDVELIRVQVQPVSSGESFNIRLTIRTKHNRMFRCLITLATEGMTMKRYRKDACTLTLESLRAFPQIKIFFLLLLPCWISAVVIIF